jgi:hypothetical protein
MTSISSQLLRHIKSSQQGQLIRGGISGIIGAFINPSGQNLAVNVLPDANVHCLNKPLHL